MTEPEEAEGPDGPDVWGDAVLAARLFVVDPAGLGGAVVRALPGPVRDRWLALLRALLPEGVPVRRVPLHVADDRLLGGLDLAATLSAGRPIVEKGLLAEADGGVLVLAMAERVSPFAAGRLTAALDIGEVLVERDGLACRMPARVGMVALDESMTDEERPPTALQDRLAFHLDLTQLAMREAEAGLVGEPQDIVAARDRLASVAVDDKLLDSLCAATLALGIESLRAPLFAVRAARASAALAGRAAVADEDAALAARLVFGPRATIVPLPEPPPDDDIDDPPPDDEQDRPPEEQPTEEELQQLQDMILAAAQAAIPPGLLAQLQMGGRARARSQGRVGAQQKAATRGRPAGTRRGEPRGGKRLNVVETLRAAAPWQPLRRRGGAGPRVEVRPDDFRISRFKHRTETTTIFVVDASGSSALHRLAEAKGAVELLLADCYVRRDKVALLAFRGRGADLLLPPTRSLVRAKRALASLPGGGGTPLALGLDAAGLLADGVRRKGQTPVIVVLTDGRPNVGRDGKGGRPKAEEDSLAAARMIRAEELTVMLVDTSPHRQPFAKKLATEMAAVYLPLPYADAGTISEAVRATTASLGDQMSAA